MAQFLQHEEESLNSLIGYARTDILERNITFGLWNRRPENSAEVKKLTDSFLRNGIYRYFVAHAVPLVISKARLADEGWISAQDERLDFKDPATIPVLRLLDDPKSSPNGMLDVSDAPPVFAAGGRHRTGALKEYHKIQLAMKSNYKKKVSEWESAVETEPDNEEFRQSLEKYSRVLKVVSNDVDIQGDWLVAIYDEGEKSHSKFHESTRLYDGVLQRKQTPTAQRLRITLL
jgi:hypothetical protein